MSIRLPDGIGVYEDEGVAKANQQKWNTAAACNHSTSLAKRLIETDYR
jgi:hypothetical protein